MKIKKYLFNYFDFINFDFFFSATYTYSMTVPLERNGKDKLNFAPFLLDSSSSAYQNFAEVTREALDRMIMQSELRDIYHGMAVTGFKKDSKEGNVLANFYIQVRKLHKCV